MNFTYVILRGAEICNKGASKLGYGLSKLQNLTILNLNL